MKTFMYDFSKDKSYSTTPTADYIKKYTYVDLNFRHAWKPGIQYNRGDVVFDYIETKKFFILYFSGVSSSVDTIYEDALEWDEYIPISTSTMTNFNEILLQGDISKYKTDDTYYDVYSVPHDIKIEQLAWEYYGDVDKWDVILVLNELSTYLDLPKNNDIIIDKVLVKLKKWGDLFGYIDEDYEYLDNYINLNRWGISKQIRTSFIDSTSTGAYYLEKGDLISVNTYGVQDNVLFSVKSSMPEIKVISYNDIFPLNDSDIISFDISATNILGTVNTVSISHTAHDVLTSTLEKCTDDHSIVQNHYNKINTSDLGGVVATLDNVNCTITLKTDPNLVHNLRCTINQSSTRTDVLSISTDSSITINEAIDAGYIEKANDDFILLDYDNEPLISKYELLYEMYTKYYNELQEKNDNNQFIKILKPEYMNEFKKAFRGSIDLKGE